MYVQEEKGKLSIGVKYCYESGSSRKDDIVYGVQELGDGTVLKGELGGIMDMINNIECEDPLVLFLISRPELELVLESFVCHRPPEL